MGLRHEQRKLGRRGQPLKSPATQANSSITDRSPSNSPNVRRSVFYECSPCLNFSLPKIPRSGLFIYFSRLIMYEFTQACTQHISITSQSVTGRLQEAFVQRCFTRCNFRSLFMYVSISCLWLGKGCCYRP